jgi:hypothetical protein
MDFRKPKSSLAQNGAQTKQCWPAPALRDGSVSPTTGVHLVGRLQVTVNVALCTIYSGTFPSCCFPKYWYPGTSDLRDLFRVRRLYRTSTLRADAVPVAGKVILKQ